MILGKVAGTVVASSKFNEIEGARYLLIEKCDQQGRVKGDFVVAVDLVGAAYEELVMVTEGSPSRETPQTVNKAVDAIVVGIVDMIDEFDVVVYKK